MLLKKINYFLRLIDTATVLTILYLSIYLNKTHYNLDTNGNAIWKRMKLKKHTIVLLLFFSQANSV